jgi:hypothetical protein
VADISDITNFLAIKVAAIVYPNGTAAPSVAPIFPGFVNPMDVRIFEGWPLPDQLDLDVGGKMLSGTPPAPVPRPNGPAANISIYPVPGAAAPAVFQILDETYTVIAPVYGVAFSVSGTVITCSGAPNAGEYLSAIIDRTSIVSSNKTPLSALLADLAAQAVTAGYAATSTATTLTIPYKYQLDVRQGGVGTLGKVSHRQRQGVMVTVWAPTHHARDVIAAAVDNVLKQGPQDNVNACLKMNLPDGTMALLLPSHTTQTDEQQVVTIYRRDLVYVAEYATLTTFPGYVVTSTTINISAGEYGSPVYTGPQANAVV